MLRNNCGTPSHYRLDIELVNIDLRQEKEYDLGIFTTIIANCEPLLTVEQKIIYNRVMLIIAFFFLVAPGETGKIFLISFIIEKILHHRKSHYQLNRQVLRLLC